MLQNRRLLADIFSEEHCDDDTDNYEEVDDIASCSSFSDSNHATSETLSEDNFSGLSPEWSSGASSSGWGSQPTNNSWHQTDSMQDDESSIESTSSTLPSSRRNDNRHRSHNSTRMSHYKHTGLMSSQKPYCDLSKVRSDYQEFMNELKKSDNNSVSYSNIVQNSWQTIFNAVQSNEQEVGMGAIELMSQLCEQGLMEPQAMLTLLQHGLIYSLRNAINMIDDGTVLVCNFLTTLIKSIPTIVPYLIEVMVNSKIADELKERLLLGSNEDIHSVVRFYHQVTEIMILPLSSGNYQTAASTYSPLVPEVLLRTGITRHTVESYSPKSTMQKCLTPGFIKNLIAKCLTKSCVRQEALVNMALELLANVIKLAYMESACEKANTDWTVKALCCLRDSKIVDKLQFTIKNLCRLAKTNESSEHCSQGVGIDVAITRLQERCSQFLSFYQQYFEVLSQNYNHLMSSVVEACENSLSDQQSTSDCWILD